MTARLPAAGERVGDYVVERLLGQGGMGAVFVARHQASGARHALKVLRGDEAHGPAALRFAREAQALARVDRHPNVVRVHGAGVRPDGLSWCALDLVEGGDLERRLREGPLPVPEVLRLGEGVARALAHLHAAGVTHRDVKPANVLLAGPERRPVLTDLGIAHDALDTRLTRTGELLGTPAAMSPEQAQGLKELVGPPSDVWALGVLLHELLTGELPWTATTLHGLIIAICAAPAPPVRERRPEVPAALEALVLECLSKERAGRPSAAGVADALAALARGEGTGRSGPGSSRLLAALAAGLVLLLGAGALLELRRERRGGRAPSPPAGEAAAAASAARSVERAERLERAREAARRGAATDAADARAAAARLDLQGLRRALAAARERDPAAAAAAAREASAEAARRWRDAPQGSPDREAALRLLDAAADVAPPAPGAAEPFLAQLARAVRASDWRATARAAERARAADPGAAVPPEASGVLHTAATDRVGDGREDEAVEVLCGARRAGIELVLESRTLDGIERSGALDRAIARRPDDWAARLWRCQAIAQWSGLAGMRPDRAVRLYADARAVLAQADVPLASRAEARVQELAGAIVIDPAGHAARCEQLWRDPSFPDRRRLAWIALRGALAVGRPDLGAPWGPRLVEAIDDVARRTALGALGPGEEPVREEVLRLVRAHQLWVQALVDSGRAEEALTLTDAMERRGLWRPETLVCRAQALLRLGRPGEALALADEALALSPSSGEASAVRDLCRAAVAAGNGGPGAQGPR